MSSLIVLPNSQNMIGFSWSSQFLLTARVFQTAASRQDRGRTWGLLPEAGGNQFLCHDRSAACCCQQQGETDFWWVQMHRNACWSFIFIVYSWESFLRIVFNVIGKKQGEYLDSCWQYGHGRIFLYWGWCLIWLNLNVKSLFFHTFS